MRKLLLFVVMMLIVVPVIASPASAEGSWAISVRPMFAFSGDTVNVTVTNSGSDRYGFVQLAAPNGSSISEEFFTLDEMGVYSFNLTLPYWLKSGDYTLQTIAGGVIVAEATVNVTLDQLVYREILDALTNQRIDTLQQRVANLNSLILQEIEIREQTLLIVEITACIVAFGSVVMALMFKPYVEWKLSKYRGNNTVLKGWKLLTHLPPEGDHAPHMEGASSIRNKVLAERRMKEQVQVQEQVVPKKKVVIQKKVVTSPVTIKQEADEWDLTTLPGKLDALSEGPGEPEEDLTQPIILPWNASRELEEELHQKAALQRRKLVYEPRPKPVVKDATKGRKKQPRKVFLAKPEVVK